MLGLLIQPILLALRWLGVSIVPWLISGAISAVVGRILLAVAYFSAVSVAANYVVSLASSQLSGVPANIFNGVQYFGVLTAISIVISAYMFKLALKSAFVSKIT
ncbi:MAG: DUF2523 family protein [Burkholderiales bacterium]